MDAKKAVFLDKDGILNNVVFRENQPASPRTPSEFSIIDDAIEPVQRIKEAGFLTIVVTNQPDISRGLMQWDDLYPMLDDLKEHFPLDDVCICAHDDKDACPCRKPKPGLLTEAAKKWGIDLKKSYLIGDGKKDVLAAKAAGCKAVKLKRPYNQDVTFHYAVDSMSDAAEWILKDSKQ
jgi:D-glycero-D-manno-heptose 1,7-bisphosphate phosphatase